MKYYIISGEASGDLHGSNLMKGLYASDPECDIRFWGGDKMASVGGTIVRHFRETAVMGFVEVLGKARKLLSNLSFCKKDILEYSPDVIILIDYAGFNLKIAKFAKEHQIKVFYYIAPKVWAWKEGRIKDLKKYVDKLFIIFPFEIEYFKKHGIDAVYRGNPLIDSVGEHPCQNESKEAFLKKHSLEDRPIIALLAGSRTGEISWLMPHYKRFSELQVQSDFSNYQILLAGAPSIDEEYYNKWLRGSNIKLIKDDTYGALKWADAAVVASGTASLETALIGTPQVVCYGGNPITIAIAKWFVKLNYISLANLILDNQIFKELIQEECSGENIMKEVESLLFDNEYREVMLKKYSSVKEILGGEGASVKIANAMIQELKK